MFFPYDSAALTPQAQVQLEPLGRALQGRALSAHRFLIGGHTDAAGEPGYNRKLSLARARAVRAHLIEVYGVAPERLLAYGWGQGRPKDPARPLSGLNRRVEVALVAPQAWLSPEYRLALMTTPAYWESLEPAEESACSDLLRDPRAVALQDLDGLAAAPTALPCHNW
ncbi:hypothetical protein MEX01_40720 [Methylorubrum extorquens]|uniref:OmpA family protein n=1 Tax=Methylorubrum extorquens TaxID=408 RepID=UPI001174634F|nr:OmpA family protein [Methylorubrum extorquens]GEL43481.1 hypothetical protein MEX01_40720 [Methylorubrum extorquens]